MGEENGIKLRLYAGEFLVNLTAGRWYIPATICQEGEKEGKTIIIDITEEVKKTFPGLKVSVTKEAGP